MIYIHIPYCERKCAYCAFNSKVGDAAEKNFYVGGLIREINQRGDKTVVETVYFGGGTPTTLEINQRENFLWRLRGDLYSHTVLRAKMQLLCVQL